MDIKFEVIEEKDREIINNLLQFESYDFCQYYNNDLSENGLFNDKLQDFYIKEKLSYIIRVDGKIAGFMLIRQKIGLKAVEEFWVYPKYRKGLLAYRFLIEFSKIETGLVEFLILKKNDRWMRDLEYMFNKHSNHVKIKKIKDYQLLINSDIYEFRRFLVELPNKNTEKKEN